jgi:ParB/RepB/Spo0J family partition protein
LDSDEQVVQVALDQVDLSDTQFKFRMHLRVGRLLESLRDEGQQFPVLLRRKGGKYQIISGFRRVTALTQLADLEAKRARQEDREPVIPKVLAVVRDDLEDDATATRVSIIENEERQSYNDLDRAYAILAYRRTGKTNAEVAEVFNVGKRQIERLQELTKLPADMQDALADQRAGFDATKAVRIMQYARKASGKRADALAKKWLDWTLREQATYQQLNAALKADESRKRESRPIKLYVEQTKAGEMSLRVRPISIDTSLSAEQKRALLKDLRAVVEFVEGL